MRSVKWKWKRQWHNIVSKIGKGRCALPEDYNQSYGGNKFEKDKNIVFLIASETLC